MTVRYLLDADTVSHLIRGGNSALETSFRSRDASGVAISSITRAELRFGVARRPEHEALAARVQTFLDGMPCIAWDRAAADSYGAVRSLLERKGRPIGNMDTMLAAHALAVGATLVTNNERHFRMVEGLAVENWS